MRFFFFYFFFFLTPYLDTYAIDIGKYASCVYARIE